MISSKNPATGHTEYLGLSTDARPSMAINGDTFLEMDTSKLFMYDAQNKIWRLQNTGSGPSVNLNIENGSGENSLQQKGNTASGKDSFAHGLNNVASNVQSHAEGYETQAVGNFSHSEGQASVAWADISHAEGVGNIVGNTNETEVRSTGEGSHAEGYGNIVFGKYAHVSGRNNIVWKNYSTVVGEFNNDASTAMFAVGNGTDSTHRSNAFEVYQDGHVEIGLMGSTNKSVATKEYVDSVISSSVTESIEGEY